ncbi:LysR family transcriptional regulator [Roseibacillus persicicus]|uniref:LysR family transcriptional regulator n=1 Tax=Roseibacillus persicicus TaxID=454148 RepID=UPI00280CE705|nr:LysR family transcriptional regulator [Roseibacillus persicicus]MDQ8190139.1 LysR family transcriptional regulator [Roseibacillus persicicus]
MMVNLEWFRTFKAIYERGSMTAAAEHLLVSQPGVSLHLSSLENHVGYKLFERRPRQLVPTERGKQLYNAIVDPISRLEEIEVKSQRSTSEDRPTITLGMCFETFQLSLEEAVPELPFNLILEFGEYRQLLKKLENQVTDLVVTPQSPELGGVRYERFSQETIVLAAGKGLDVSGFDPADPDGLREWLQEQPWYGIAGDNDHMLRFWKQNFRQSPGFRPNYIVPNFHSILRNLSRAPGLAIIPDFLCRQVPEVTVLWEGYQPLINQLHFARHKNSKHDAELAQIMALVRRRMPPLVL